MRAQTFIIIQETPSGPVYMMFKRGTRETRRRIFAITRDWRKQGYWARIYRGGGTIT